jgi:hypothetical protein
MLVTTKINITFLYKVRNTFFSLNKVNLKDRLCIFPNFLPDLSGIINKRSLQAFLM